MNSKIKEKDVLRMLNHTQQLQGKDEMKVKYQLHPKTPKITLHYTLEVEMNESERREIWLISRIPTISQDI